jgi:hypothetical protein
VSTKIEFNFHKFLVVATSELVVALGRISHAKSLIKTRENVDREEFMKIKTCNRKSYKKKLRARVTWE